MRSLVPVNLVQMGMGFILLIGGVGCATTSDLEKLNQGLDKQEKSLSTVEEEVRNLRAEIGKFGDQLQGIRQTVGDVEKLPSRVTDLNTEVQSLRAMLLEEYQLEEAALTERLQRLEQIRTQLRPEVTDQPVATDDGPAKSPSQEADESQDGGGSK